MSESESASIPVSATLLVPISSSEDSSTLGLESLASANLEASAKEPRVASPGDTQDTAKINSSLAKSNSPCSASSRLISSGDCSYTATHYPESRKDIDAPPDTFDMGVAFSDPTKSMSTSSMMAHLLSSQETTQSDAGVVGLAPLASSEDLTSVTLNDVTLSTKSNEVLPQTDGNAQTSPTKDTAAAPSKSSSCCRICQEGRSEEQLISPCYCSGTMGKVHLSCMETWLQLMHRSSCELCQYEFPVERIPQPTYKFFLNPGSSTEFANLMCDITCFLILTPLLIITMFLCTRGVKYYDTHGKTGSMFAVVTLIGSLLVVYVSWAVLAFLYHYRIWRNWRENTVTIKMSVYKRPGGAPPPVPTDPKKNKSVNQCAACSTAMNIKKGNEYTQTEIIGSSMNSSSEHQDHETSRRMFGFTSVDLVGGEGSNKNVEMVALQKGREVKGSLDVKNITQTSARKGNAGNETCTVFVGDHGDKAKFADDFNPCFYAKKKDGKGK